MSNYFVEKMRKVFELFNGQAKKIYQEMDNNNKTYLPESAQRENENLQKQLDGFYLVAKEEIVNIFDDVKRKLSLDDFPTIESVTGDERFFNGTSNVQLNPVEIKAYLEKYRNNATMTRIIANWIDKEHPETDGKMDEWTDIRNSIVPTIEKVNVYKKFSESALSLVDSIYNSQNEITELTISSFADDDFSKPLFDKIGDGKYLLLTTDRDLPESAKEKFADVVLQD